MSGDASAVTIALFGLGEAGTSIARDIVDRGGRVHAFDPAPQPTPDSVIRHDEPAVAVDGVDAVLAATAAADAEAAVMQALDAIPDAAVYADLSTSAPDQKAALAAHAAGRQLPFVDVALMSTVPGKGLGTPQLVAGSGVARYRAVLAALDLDAEPVGEQPGAAATRKLLRSVVTKGLAALFIEALEAGDAADLREWLWHHLVDELETWDGAFAKRLVAGTGPHAERRQHEMEAAVRMLTGLGVEPRMTIATVDSLRAALRSPPAAPPDLL